MLRKGSIPLILTGCLVLVACQAKGVNTPPRAAKTPVAVKASAAPAAIGTPAPPEVSALPTAPAVSPTPDRGPLSTASDLPISRPPSEKPTPLPSGRVSPLPRDQFPPDPSPTPTIEVSATPVPSPSPTTLADAQVLSNTLDFGAGSIGGYVYDPLHQLAVGGGSITIAAKTDPNNKKAVIINAGDGTYQLNRLADGVYYVWIEKTGYVGDTAPTEVHLQPFSNQRTSTNLTLVKKD